VINFEQGRKYLMKGAHGNYGGPGYLDIALVRIAPEASWASYRGERQLLRLQVAWSGEMHRVDLGPVRNGTLALEFAFLDIGGASRLAQTSNISLPATAESIARAAKDVGVHLRATANETAAGEVSWWLDFLRPTYRYDGGDGYSVTLRFLNVTCWGECTTQAGSTAVKLAEAEPFDWTAQLTLAWNGARLAL
jgi:hypothetical protein